MIMTHKILLHAFFINFAISSIYSNTMHQSIVFFEKACFYSHNIIHLSIYLPKSVKIDICIFNEHFHVRSISNFRLMPKRLVEQIFRFCKVPNQYAIAYLQSPAIIRSMVGLLKNFNFLKN